MNFLMFNSLDFNSIRKEAVSSFFRFGFVLWLWSFLFARVPLAAIQDLFGLESRPLLLLDCLSVGFAFFAFSKVGLRPLGVFKSSVVKVGGLSFALFWAFYSVRLGFDHWVLSVELVTPASVLFKHLLTSTLIPALCLPWIVSMATWSLTLPVLVGLGSISLLFGEISFIFISGFDTFLNLRFAFEDLNPIPAAQSSTSLVIISSLFLLNVICQSSRNRRAFGLLLGLIGLFSGLLGIQLAMTKGAFVALVPLVIYLGCCLWKHFGVFWFSGLLSASAIAVVSMFGGMRRDLGAPASFVDRFQLILQSLSVWTNHWFLGVGFCAQNILHSNPLTVSNHWYPHNFAAEVLLLGGVVLMILVVCFIVSVGLSACFDVSPAGLEDSMQVPLTFLWLQGFGSALVSGHIGLIPGLWVGGLIVVLNRFR